VSYYKQLKTKLKQTKGFTLIELLVVIAIIGILSSVVLASLNGARESSRDARRQTDMSQMQTSLSLYANDNNGDYPDNLSGLVSEYMSQVPDDPSGGSYDYAASGDNNDYCLAARMEGGTSSVPQNDTDCDDAGDDDVFTLGENDGATVSPSN